MSREGDDDPINPYKYSQISLIAAALLVDFISFVVMLSSPIDSALAPQVSADIGVSCVVEATIEKSISHGLLTTT